MSYLVSVVVTCFNLGEYIDECIESIISQTYKKIEIVLVDDGSTDQLTKDKIKELVYKQDIRVVHQKNAGVSVARNNGAALTSGTFIMFLDGDDCIDKDYISKAINILENDNSIDLVYCDLKEFGLNNGTRVLPQFSLGDLLLYCNLIPACVFRKRLWNKCGGFNPEYIHGWEDWDFWIRLSSNSIKVQKISEPLFRYRIRNNSRDSSVFKNKMDKNLEQQVLKNNLDTYLSIYQKPISLLREYEILKRENARFELYKAQIYGSWSYKLGNFLLYPLKKTKEFFTKLT
jgi:glycosyltransferase involved in cell wall biosynthesis